MREQINNPENQFFCYRSCNEIFFSAKEVGVVSQFISSCPVDTFVNLLLDITTQNMKFFIKDLSVNMTKSLMENFIFCVAHVIFN